MRAFSVQVLDQSFARLPTFHFLHLTRASALFKTSPVSVGAAIVNPMAMAPGTAAPNSSASSAPVTTTVTVAGGGSGAGDALALQQQAAAERAEVILLLHCLLLCALSARFKNLTRYQRILF